MQVILDEELIAHFEREAEYLGLEPKYCNEAP